MAQYPLPLCRRPDPIALVHPRLISTRHGCDESTVPAALGGDQNELLISEDSARELRRSAVPAGLSTEEWLCQCRTTPRSVPQRT